MRRLMLLTCLTVSLAGCGRNEFIGRPDLQLVDGAQLPAPTREDLTVPARPYVIGPSDQLAIDVFGIQELSRSVTVDLTGKIAMPLVGSIQASGLTAEELAITLTQRFDANYVRDPKVSVNVVTAANQVFTIDGAVASPGVYPVVGRMSLMKAVARASGSTEFTDENFIVVFRTSGGQQYATLYDLRAIRQGMYPDPEIFTNDVIFVGDSPARRIFRDVLSASALITAPIVALVR